MTLQYHLVCCSAVSRLLHELVEALATLRNSPGDTPR